MGVAWLMLGLQVEVARIVYADRYDAAFEEARIRNVPVLIVDFDGWSTDKSNPQVSDLYESADFVAGADGAVMILAGQEDHGEKKQQVDGATRSVCSEYGGTSCLHHRDMLPKVFSDFGRDGALVSPLFVVATPDRKEVGRLLHEQQAPPILELLEKATKQLGLGLKRGDFARLDRGLKEIRRLVDAADFAPAIALIDDLKKIPGRSALQVDLLAEEEKLGETGRARLKRAEELWAAGRFLDAMIDLDDVRVSFGKLEAATLASSKLAVWEKSPEAKPVLPELKVDRTARGLYLQGLDYRRKGDPKRAKQSFEKLIKTYPDSRFCPRARIQLEQLKEEPAPKGR
jgi:hypothetical protein